MAFTDPQSVTISGTAISLPRTNTGGGGSEYASADGLVKLIVNSAHGRRRRHVIRIDHSKIAQDPLVTTANQRYSMSNYLVFDMPPAGIGYTNAEAEAVFNGFNALLIGSSNAAVKKLLGSES